jgi:hypothetical protein
MFMIRFRGRGQEAERVRVLDLNTVIAAPSDPADARPEDHPPGENGCTVV